MLTISASETLVSEFADLSTNNFRSSILDGDYDSHKVSVCWVVNVEHVFRIYANDDSNVACKKNFKNRRKKCNKKNWKFNILHNVAGT
jgi:hypothetical protein